MNKSKTSILAAALAGRGVRLTRQRRVIIEVIDSASGHLHASDILRLAREKDPSINRATVYRNLSMLKEQGLIEELDLLHLDGSEHHYEVRDRNYHVHIGCTKCGKVLELKSDVPARLEDEIRLRTGFDVGYLRIEVGAVCPDCKRGE